MLKTLAKLTIGFVAIIFLLMFGLVLFVNTLFYAF